MNSDELLTFSYIDLINMYDTDGLSQPLYLLQYTTSVPDDWRGYFGIYLHEIFRNKGSRIFGNIARQFAKFAYDKMSSDYKYHQDFEDLINYLRIVDESLELSGERERAFREINRIGKMVLIDILDELLIDYQIEKISSLFQEDTIGINEADYIVAEIDIDKLIIVKYVGPESDELIVPNTIDDKQVFGIGERAFYGCGNLKKVTISEGIKYIAKEAFAECIHIEEVLLPNTLIKIGESCFNMDINLKKINIPYGITEIPNGAFSCCESLKDVDLPKSLRVIGPFAFHDCSSLPKIEFPESLAIIDNYAFSDCRNLSGIRFKEGLQYIGDKAFSSCDSLKNIILPFSLFYVADEPFGKTDSNHPVGMINADIMIYCFSDEMSYMLKNLGYHNIIRVDSVMNCKNLNEFERLQSIDEFKENSDDTFENILVIDDDVRVFLHGIEFDRSNESIELGLLCLNRLGEVRRLWITDIFVNGELYVDFDELDVLIGYYSYDKYTIEITRETDYSEITNVSFRIEVDDEDCDTLISSDNVLVTLDTGNETFTAKLYSDTDL